jgi:K+-sensing histidine kinase KdpD
VTERPARRPKLSRSAQRYNYLLAAAAVFGIVAITVWSPQVTLDGLQVPVFLLAVLVAAFLFGLGQMVVGITRRRRFLAGLPPEDAADRDP